MIMKRPLAVSGFTALILVLCFIHSESTALAFCVLIFAASGLVVSTFLKSKQAVYWAALSVGAVLACLLFMNTELRKEQTFHLCDENTTVQAVISERPEFSHDNGRYYAVAKLKSIGGEKAYGKIRLSFSETNDGIDPDSLSIGDKISFDGTVYKIGESSEEIHNYYSSIGIYTGSYGIENLNIELPKHRPLKYYVDKIRISLTKKINYTFDQETAGLVIAILTGDKDYTEDGTYSLFKKSGAAHIMAVSGMHLSVWILFLSLVLDRIKHYRVLTHILLSISVIFIMFLASFSPSVMRAGFMVLLNLFGKAIGRKADGLNSLGFATICLLCINPYIAVSVGFQLSFLSVAAIFMVALPCHEFLTRKLANRYSFTQFEKAVSAAVMSLCISFSVALFTFPVCAVSFGGVSIISPITNMLLLPVMTPLIVISAIFSLFSFIPVISTALSFVLKIIAVYTLKVVDFSASIPFSYLPTDFSHLIGWSVFALLFFITVLLIKKKMLSFAKISVSVLAFSLFFSVYTELKFSVTSYKITPLVSENDCCYILSKNNRGILVGLSDYYYFETNVKKAAEKLGVSIDAIICLDNENRDIAEYIAAEHKTEYILDDEGERIVLFGEVEIEHKGSYAYVEGYGIYTLFFQKEGLQSDLGCDIMYDKYGVTLYDNGKETETYDYSFADTAVVSKKGNYSIRGEIFG